MNREEDFYQVMLSLTPQQREVIFAEIRRAEGKREPGLMSLEDVSNALKPLSVSVRILRKYASKETPQPRRLRVVQISCGKIGVRPQDLEIWKEKLANF